MKVNVCYMRFESVPHFVGDISETLTEPSSPETVYDETELVMNMFKQGTPLCHKDSDGAMP